MLQVLCASFYGKDEVMNLYAKKWDISLQLNSISSHSLTIFSFLHSSSSNGKRIYANSQSGTHTVFLLLCLR